MITSITGLPDNVLGFTAHGEVTAEDYRSVLIPAVEAKLSKVDQVRMLYVLGEGFEGITSAAAWEDTKVGLKHLTQLNRIAVVSSVDWINTSIKAFGFMMPCEVRVFENSDLQDAITWISEPVDSGSLEFDFLEEPGVLILRPQGELDVADFARVSSRIDPHIEKTGTLEGVMIVARHFPGWDTLSAFFSHLKFVRDRQKNVQKLAIVTNDRLLTVLPRIAKYLAAPEMRHFSMDQETEALEWLCQ